MKKIAILFALINVSPGLMASPSQEVGQYYEEVRPPKDDYQVQVYNQTDEIIRFSLNTTEEWLSWKVLPRGALLMAPRIKDWQFPMIKITQGEASQHFAMTRTISNIERINQYTGVLVTDQKVEFFNRLLPEEIWYHEGEKAAWAEDFVRPEVIRNLWEPVLLEEDMVSVTIVNHGDVPETMKVQSYSFTEDLTLAPQQSQTYNLNHQLFSLGGLVVDRQNPNGPIIIRRYRLVDEDPPQVILKLKVDAYTLEYLVRKKDQSDDLP
jgi:hypothetical protein